MATFWTGSIGAFMDEFDYDAISREVLSAVRQGCPVALRGEVEDVAQDVLVRLIDRHRKGEVVAARSPSYWRRAAYHGLVDELRRRRRRREQTLDDEQIEMPLGPDSASSPERGASNAELAEAIAICLRGLSEGRRIPVFLYLQGHTQPEAASLLGWAPKRAASAIFRGLRDLRSCLSGRGFKP